MQLDKQNIRKILVVTLSNLGDVVLTLPVFQSLIEAFPKAEIHTVVGEKAAEIFEGDDRIKKVIRYDKRVSLFEKIRFIARIRKGRYDLIVDLRRSGIGLLGGGRFRNSYFSFYKKTLHRAQRHWRSLEGLSEIPFPEESFLKGAVPSAPANSGDTHRILNSVCVTGISEITGDSRLVVVAVGSKSDIKKWPAKHYSKLLDRLMADHACRVILIGDARDTADAERVKAGMKHRPEDLCGKTNFRELVDILSKAALLITNDSAPLHIADSLGVPVLAIFGPTDPRKYGPRGASSRIARREVFCSPCEKAQCRYHHECMKELGWDEVYQKALQILNDEFRPRNLKILVIRLDRVGDLVLTLPALQAIRNRFPNASLSVMVRPYTREIVEGNPSLDEVIPYFYEQGGRHSGLLGGLRFVREIVKRHFDIAFILHPSTRSNLVPFLAGIPYRIGFDSHSSFLLTKKAADRRSEGLKHESEYTMDIVRAFGIQTPGVEPLPSSSQVREKIIALHPGASCPSKRWPKERFAELGKRIVENSSHRIVVIGGDEEKALGKYLAGEIECADFTGRLNLKELAAFLGRCEALVSNDSGPVHVAAWAGTKVVSIFGRNQAGLSPTRWRPLGSGHRVLQKDVGCVVCLAHACTIDFECLKAVSVDEVYAALKEVLNESD